MFNSPPLPAFVKWTRSAAVTLLLLTITVVTACTPAAAPTAVPTSAPTVTPTDAPTPTPGVGVPAKSAKWEVVITGVREMNRVSTYPNTYTPKEGYTFLVVDTKIRSLIMPKHATAAPTGAATLQATQAPIATAAATGAATAQATQVITTNAAAILAEDGTIYKADGSIMSGMGCVSCISWSYVSDDSPKQMGFVFVLSKKIVHQVFKLQFQDVPPIPFALPESVGTAAVGATPPAQSTGIATAGSPAPATQSAALGIGATVKVAGVGAAGLTVRTEPRNTAAVAFRAQEGDQFTIKDGPKTADGYDWWLIAAVNDPSRSGWAVTQYLQP